MCAYFLLIYFAQNIETAESRNRDLGKYVSNYMVKILRSFQNAPPRRWQRHDRALRLSVGGVQRIGDDQFIGPDKTGHDTGAFVEHIRIQVL